MHKQESANSAKTLNVDRDRQGKTVCVREAPSLARKRAGEGYGDAVMGTSWNHEALCVRVE